MVNEYKKLYSSELVDASQEFLENYKLENSIEGMVNVLKAALKNIENENDVNSIKDLIIEEIKDKFTFSYLQGANYAIRNNISTTKPNNDEKLSPFHENMDFAFIFNFSDNDFGLYFERAAELYCDEYNSIMNNIDMYFGINHDDDYDKKHIQLLQKKDMIIQMLQHGFLSYYYENKCDRISLRQTSVYDSIQDSTHLIKEYFNFEDNHKIYKKGEDGKYFVDEEIPNLYIGTTKEIEEVLPKFGHVWENDNRQFPVDCNGETLIVYTEDNKLKYMIR